MSGGKEGRTGPFFSYAHSRLVVLGTWTDAAQTVTVPQTCAITQWASRSPPVTRAERSSTGYTTALFTVLGEGLGIHKVLNSCPCSSHLLLSTWSCTQ